MIDIENYRKPDGEIDYDKYNADVRSQKRQRYEAALNTLGAAMSLAKANGFDLVQHTTWHFSLTYIKYGKRRWRINLYPSNQRIWADKRCGKAPFLKLPEPWTFLDVVSTAIIAAQIDPIKQALIKNRTESMENKQ